MANNDRQTTITPSEAAKRLGVEVYTVRRWCDWHAAHLSASASPGAGALRRLTQSDIEVLSMVRDLRAQGLHTETINEQLEGVTFAVVDNDTANVSSMNGESEELAPLASQEAPQSTQAIIMVVESLRSEVKAIQEARRFDAVGLVGLGIVIGLVFATMFIALASLYGG